MGGAGGVTLARNVRYPARTGTAVTASPSRAALLRQPADRRSIGSEPGGLKSGGREIGVIATGRVGSVLGAALRGAGHPLVAVSARSEKPRARAAAPLPDVPVSAPVDVARQSAG